MDDTSSAMKARAGAAADAAPIVRKTFLETYETTIFGGGFILLLLLLWEFLPHIVTLSAGTKLFFATPSQIVATFYRLFATGEIWPALAFSGSTFAVGLAVSIAFALPLGVALGRSGFLNAMIDPFITAFNATPRLVFLPLILIWFGIGLWSVVLVVFLGALFPLLINTYEGVRNADRLLINVVRSFGANEWQTNKLVVLPNALPYIVSGLRLAIGRAILGVVVAEFFGGSTTGVGVIMVNAAGKYQIDVVFAGVIIFMVLSLIMTSAVKTIEVRLTRWRPAKVKTF